MKYPHKMVHGALALVVGWCAAFAGLTTANGEEAEAIVVAADVAVVEGEAVEAVADAVAVVVDLVAPQPAIAVPVAAPAFAAGEEPPAEQVDPFLQMFKPIVQAELSFAKRACRLTPEQLTAAIDASRTWLIDYARQYAKKNGQPQNGMLIANGWQQQQQQDSPREAIEGGVVAAVKKIATSEQVAKYDAELAKRYEFQQRVVVDNLIAKIDSRICLTPKQRRALRQSLLSKWDNNWAPQMDNLVHMGDYLPQIPDKLVVPFLNAEQVEMWQAVQKVSFGRFFNGDQGFINGGQVIADIDVGELKAPAKPAEANPAEAKPAETKPAEAKDEHAPVEAAGEKQ